MKHFLIFLAALLAALPLSAQTTKQIRKLQSQQSLLKKEIAAQEGELRSNKKNVAAQLNDLSLLSAKITTQEAYVRGIHAEVSALAGRLAELEGQLATLERDLAECKRRYKRAVTYMHREKAVQSKWLFVLSAKDFRRMYRRMRYVQEFSKYQRAQGRVIEAKEKVVTAKRAELLAAKNEKDRLLAEGRTEQKKLEGQKGERQRMVEGLKAKQGEIERNIAQQRRKAEALNRKIDQLIQAEIEAAERRRKAAEAKRKREEAERRAREKREREAAAKREREAAARRKKGAATGSRKQKADNRSRSNDDESEAKPRFTEGSNADRALSSSFAANKGRLPMPVTGAYFISTRFGRYDVKGLKGVSLDSKGINVTARPGAAARAVFKGEVTAVFSYGGLWNVIVRHGAYMSVYCNLASCAVRNGQKVETKQSLGKIATDAAGNCTLHFQLRKETQKLNPESWLGR